MAEVNVRIKAQNQTRTGFQQALGDAQRFGTTASGSLRSAFSGVASDIKSSIGGALAGLASFGAIRAIIDQFGRVQDLSEQFGVSAESIQRFGQLASESGSSVEQVAAAFSRLTINIQKAQGGTGAQADALRELGLSAKELAALTPEQAFLRLADALQKAGGSNSSYAAALDLIGNRQRDLIPLLAQGADSIQAQADSVDVASADIVAKVDAIGDRFGRLGQQIAVGLGPAVALIGQLFLSVFAVVEAGVGKLASSITSSFMAIGQVMSGNFRAAGEIMRGEAQATSEQWAALQQKLSQINGQAPQRLGAGAAAQLDASEEAAASAQQNASRQKAADEAKRIREQIGQQRISNTRAGMSDEELLADLRREERRLFKQDPSGAGEGTLRRLQVVSQIDQLERQISERKRQDAKTAAQAAIEVVGAASIDELIEKLGSLNSKTVSLVLRATGLQDLEELRKQINLIDADSAQSIGNNAQKRLANIQASTIADLERNLENREFSQLPASQQQAAIDAQMAAFQAQMASGSLDPATAAQQAAQIMQMADSLKQGTSFAGSFGASDLQRIGFASNEFFDTRRKEDPAKETKRAADVAKQILDILKKGEPLVLPASN